MQHHIPRSPTLSGRAGEEFDPQYKFASLVSLSLFTGEGDVTVSSRELCKPLLVTSAAVVFIPVVGSVFPMSRFGRVGVVSSHCRLVTFRSALVSIEGEPGVFCKDVLFTCSFSKGECKKTKGEDGDSERLVTCSGELNEKFTDSVLEPSSDGVSLLLGVSGVRRAGSLVRLVLRSPSTFAPGVTLNDGNKVKSLKRN